MKISPGGADGTDRQTDRQTHVTKLIVAFVNFAKAPNNQCKFFGGLRKSL